MRTSIFFLFLFLSLTSLQAQSLYKTWKLETIAGNTIPEEMNIIMQFTEEGQLHMFSPSGNATTDFVLSKDKKTLEIKGNDKDEIWEIQSLTKDELIINDPMNGLFALKETDINPDDLAVEEPIEEPLEEEDPDFSIDSDFVPSKKDAKNIQGYWVAKSFNDQELPGEIGIALEFEKSGEMSMYINGEKDNDDPATYKLNGQKLDIGGPNGDEVWGIKALGKKELIILDKSVGEIKLEKTKKPKDSKK